MSNPSRKRVVFDASGAVIEEIDNRDVSAVRLRSIDRISNEVDEEINSSWPIEDQVLALLGVYGEEGLQECRKHIEEHIKQKNERIAEVDRIYTDESLDRVDRCDLMERA